MKNDITTCVDKPDDRKAYSEPCIKRLGRLDEIAKLGTPVVPEGLARSPELIIKMQRAPVVIGSVKRCNVSTVRDQVGRLSPA